MIQGPPGTGKSQTIANIIAAAVADGKTVLFVAEKMAALDVVKRRLDAAGVGDCCLELHSNKANKRMLLEELRRTWELGAPRGASLDPLLARLVEARDDLNGHAARLHHRDPVTGRTPYETIGHLARLRQDGHKPSDARLPDAASWTPEEVRKRDSLLAELAQRIEDIGPPSLHPWRHVELETILPTEVERLKTRLIELADDLDLRSTDAQALAAELELDHPKSLSIFTHADEVAARLAAAPDLETAAFLCPAWKTDAEAIGKVVGLGALLARITSALSGRVRDRVWQVGVSQARTTLAALPKGRRPPR